MHQFTDTGSPYQLYLDACDFGLTAIVQQVQRIQVKDLKRTKAYKCCDKAFKVKQLIPSLVVQITKLDNDVPENGKWGKTLDETLVSHYMYASALLCYISLPEGRVANAYGRLSVHA